MNRRGGYLVMTMFALVAPALGDPIKAELDAARTAYEAELAELKKGIAEALDRAEDAARSGNDQDALERIAADRARFEEDGTVPGAVEDEYRPYVARLTRARDKLLKAYEDAAEAYEKSAQHPLAAAVTQERERLASEFEEGDGEWLGLLGGVELPGDAPAGAWVREEGSLVCAAGERGLMRLKTLPPTDYALEFLATRLKGGGALQIGLRSGAARCLLILDGFDGGTSGLSCVDGVDARQNGTAHQGALFNDKRPVRVVVSVRPTEITVQADDQTIIEWSGEAKQLSLPEGLRGDGPGLFVVAAAGSSYRIDSMRLRRLPKATRHDQAAARPAGSKVERDDDSFPDGAAWKGKWNGQNCVVTLVQSDERSVTLRAENQDTGRVWRIECRRNGDSLTVTDITEEKRGGRRRGAAVISQISGGGKVAGKRLTMNFSCRAKWRQQRNEFIQSRISATR